MKVVDLALEKYKASTGARGELEYVDDMFTAIFEALEESGVITGNAMGICGSPGSPLAEGKIVEGKIEFP